ncbi:MAG TPA: response regulator [Candidatus Dormibacteraeota bacterium]
MKAPLQAEGLARRVYPFLGLAIVGLVSLRGFGAVAASPALVAATVTGVLLVLLPLAPIEVGRWSRPFAAGPVVVGFALALFPLWAAPSVPGIAATVVLVALGSALVVLPWERIPRGLHALPPLSGFAVALVLSIELGLSATQALAFLLLPLLFLALYYTTLEFAIGAAVAVADLVVITLTNPAAGDPAHTLLEALLLVALGVLVHRVVADQQRSSAAATAAEAGRSDVLSDLAQRNQELQELTRLKSEFLATMSHEIRTPMNGVIGMTGLLLDTELTSEQRDYVETIRTSGDTLLDIINDILDFSKIEAGRVRMETIDFSPKHVTEEAVELFAEPAANKGVELILDVDPAVPHSVIGDPGRLRQVLINLVGNAIKFTDSGEVVVRVQKMDSMTPGVMIRFEVADTGVGLTDEEQGRVFSTYAQIDSSTTRRHGGTGLGLAIARMLTQLMGGEIGVESEKGAGSRFWFTALFRESEIKATEPQPVGTLAGTAVAIIDDNRTNRVILERYLDSWGTRERSFESGSEALRALRNAVEEDDPFEVAIVDLMMPEMDGADVASSIRADPKLKEMVVVLLTSAGRSEKPVPGVDIELVKPVRPSQLFDVLQSLMASRPGHTKRRINREGTGPPATRHRWARILVAEDNAANLKVAVRMVERLGYRADVAGNGSEALQALDRVPYDAVLMDCQMPEMDGYEATREIRKAERDGRHVPIIAMTASAMAGDRERCLAAGMDDYISKPVKLHIVAAVLERWLGPEGEQRQT